MVAVDVDDSVVSILFVLDPVVVVPHLESPTVRTFSTVQLPVTGSTVMKESSVRSSDSHICCTLSGRHRRSSLNALYLYIYSLYKKERELQEQPAVFILSMDNA